MIRMWPSCGATKVFVMVTGFGDERIDHTLIAECGRGLWHGGMHRGKLPTTTGEGDAAWL